MSLVKRILSKLHISKKKNYKEELTIMSPKEEHIDDWLDTPTRPGIKYADEKYAKFVLEFARMPAFKQTDYKQWYQQFELFCTFAGKRWKVTGASRLGDIYITSNFNKEMGSGYEHRVSIKECSGWSSSPSEIFDEPDDIKTKV